MSYKYFFCDDYSEGAHPKILEILNSTNLLQEKGYGSDSLSSEAAALIKQKFSLPNSEVHFITGGTLANLIVTSAMLRPHQSIIAPCTGHVEVHEAGAIEATGHKINTVDTADGKLRPEDIESVLAAHIDEHMVKPKAVVIANSTERGTVYSLPELQAVSKTCRDNGLYLYIDGARLGVALDASGVSISEIGSLCDVLYIGGTKNGALLGEAVLINEDSIKEDFRYLIKQRGALMAKGRVLGAQFKALFEDNLYLELASHANTMAAQLAEGIKGLGYKFLAEPESNMIFPILPEAVAAKMEQEYLFYRWMSVDESNTAIRLVTSWATKPEAVGGFVEDLGSC